jgi:uncharacterized protein YdeI (YjbR/CyaY-like superfamily)
MYKKATGRPSVTWPEVVDECLAFGWIDSIRKSIDEISYTNRITPRRKNSNWSAVNIRRVAELEAQGRMQPAGRRAFEGRNLSKSDVYSYEHSVALMGPEVEATFRANEAAWAWFERAAPSYRKAVMHWLASAVKPETRARRLALVIEHAEAGQRIPSLTSPAAPKER